MSDWKDWLDDKRKKDIEVFKVKHPAQYYCITQQAKEQGALDFEKWINQQKKDCEKDLMLYGDYYNKLLIGEMLIKSYKDKELEGCEKK